MFEAFWIMAICGSWLAALVAIAKCFDVRDWWQERQDVRRIERRLRALGEWRRTGIYRRKEKV